MRRAAERGVWKKLKKRRNASVEAKVVFGGVDIGLSTPCLVVGGRNGAGKSRLLRTIAEAQGADGLLLNLHSIVEQVLSILKSRDDFSDMKDEVSELGPSADRRDDVERIVGRNYDFVAWYALEIELEQDRRKVAEQFRWGGDQTLLPYFDVQHQGVHYSSKEMGLGEFSVHLLFWIIEQYRDSEGLTLILDEPDAYLPPVGVSALLVRILAVCLQRRWQLVVATHSAEMIADSLDSESFLLLRVGDSGAIAATHCRDDPAVADHLMARPPIRLVCFVEDESAWILTKVLLESYDRQLAKTSAVIWGNGSGYMSELQKHFPKPPQHAIRYAYVFDGDQRNEIAGSPEGRWPALFLPTDKDPDTLFRSVGSDVAALASRLNVPREELARFLDSEEGMDPHDWVNGFCEQYERQRVLRVLAELWVESNEQPVASFVDDLTAAFK